MPIYEYSCQNCHKHFEILQGINDEPEKICEACHKPALVKQISAAGFQLKGSGWYVTDFKNKTPKTTTSESNPTEDKKTTTESKPVETKKESSEK